MSIGYSVDKTRGTERDRYMKLRRAVKKILTDHTYLAHLSDVDEDFVGVYLGPVGCAVTFKEDGEDAPQIIILASGGNPGRGKKESVMRAIAALAMEQMQKEGVNLNVTFA